MTDPDNKSRDDLLEAIRKRDARRTQWTEQGERPLWKNLSMIGALGWLIVGATLLGIVAGRWLDHRFGTGVTFSGALTFGGACLGFYMAWQRMNSE
jgi:ATP synthase protein I